jgi:hypothetical protein
MIPGSTERMLLDNLCSGEAYLVGLRSAEGKTLSLNL